MKLLVSIKMQKERSKSKDKKMYNPVKLTGSNVNGSLGIGNEDS